MMKSFWIQKTCNGVEKMYPMPKAPLNILNAQQMSSIHLKRWEKVK